MNREISLSVIGTPAPQPRPRMTRAGRAYNPPSADVWKQAVRDEWTSLNSPPFLNGLRLCLSFLLPRPASHFTSKGALTKSAPLMPVGKPDVDNLAKAVMDALENAGAFANDCAVISLTVSKRYAMLPQVAGCLIDLSEID